MSDAELILRARGGDELAFQRLVKRHDRRIRGIASNYFIAGAGDDDLYQEALLGFHQAVSGYKPERNDNFPSFASLCIKRQVITAVNGANRKKHMVLSGRRDLTEGRESEMNPEEHHQAYADLDSDPLHRLVQQEDWDEVRRLCLTLSTLEGEALGLFLSDYSYNEIAEHIGCTHKTVDNAIQRCRRKVSEGMAVAA